MTIDTTDVRRLVTRETISAIEPIENADSIVAATVRGWTVVVKKGDFAVGDECLYFELDSALPVSDERFAFLEPRGTKIVNGVACHVLKTARLRGVYSQGLVLPLGRLGQIDFHPTTDLATTLGIVKYEPPIPANLNAIGPFPAHLLKKTDSERVQNLTAEYDEILTAGPWIATEKVDGTSLTVVRDHDGVLHVSSRNWELAPPAADEMPNLYWRAVLENGLDSLNPGHAVQAEIAGPGIQGNPLNLPDVRVVIFSYLVDGVPQPREAWPTFDSENVLVAPVYDLQLAPTVSGAVEQVEKIRSLVAASFGQDRGAEGVVWHRASGEPLSALRDRSCFKSLSNAYILKAEKRASK